ncbi:hypothetical protein DRH29_04760 [candidate division Kazan bacterium]|uniref:Uncharacterized protein n=1 Tax=candidate division Kazan bacterium TaxID=2202143 RepID=A0A420ZBK7_UNCK3|nr:MAG: hypothetical protein DRH29_04760 [candidate division Kazan bacterium]
MEPAIDFLTTDSQTYISNLYSTDRTDIEGAYSLSYLSGTGEESYFGEKDTGPNGNNKESTSILHMDKADWYDEAVSELTEILKECGSENWDGHGSLPISYGTYSKARELLKLIPQSLPKPSIVPEPENEIGFEWWIDPKTSFVISVKDDDKITFAGLLGKNREIWGVEVFEDSFPQLIYENVKRLFSQSNGY